MTWWDELKAEFPRDQVSWRAQTLTKAGDKALALAYIDSRDVMNRLDDVVGPANWQDRYEVYGGKTICYLSVWVAGDGTTDSTQGEWVTKADGAGDTAVEAEKGSLSDAFKRAAVKWGIGRYLYDLDAVWVPCETYESNGKKHWSKWKGNPWDFVRGAPKPQPIQEPKQSEPKSNRLSEDKARDLYARMQKDLNDTANEGPDAITSLMKSDEMVNDLASLPEDWERTLVEDAKSLYRAAKTFFEENEGPKQLDAAAYLKEHFPGAAEMKGN